MELAVGASVQKQCDVSLSLYDRQLWQDYGLHGMPEQAANTDVLFLMLPEISQDSWNVEPLDPIWDTKQLELGIHGFMKTRLVSSVISDLFARVRQFSAPFEGQDNIPSLPENDGHTWSASSSATLLTNYSRDGTLASLITEVVDTYEDRREDIQGVDLESSDESMERKHLDELQWMHSQTQELEELLNEAVGSEGLGSLSFLAEGVSELLLSAQQPLDGIYGSLALREYTLGMLTHRCSLHELDREEAPSRGVNLRGLAFSSGRRHQGAEVEIIISEKEESADALKYVENRVIALRVLFNLIGILGNEQRMNRYQIQAAIISGVITALTLGYVAIPPEAIQAGLVLAASYRAGKKDGKQLFEGKTVPLLPHTGRETMLQTVYEDYLRLLLLAKSDDVILQQVATCIQSNLGGAQFGSGVRVAVHLSEGEQLREYAVEKRYLAYETVDASNES